MLEIRNQTPLVTRLVPALDKSGHNHVVVVMKGSFTIRHQTPLELADQQQPILLADDYYAEPGTSSLRYEADTAMRKAATDIVVIGHAYAAKDSAGAVDVSLQIGNLQKTRRVLGNRHWEKLLHGWHATPAEKFERMALVYENAYGGVDATNPVQPSPPYLADNPVGKGFIGNQSKPEEGLALPNIENPAALIQHWQDKPAPVGFGFIGRNWQPRMGLAGTYDQAWQEQRLPLLPLDFDERYFNGAHADFIVPPGLSSDENFQLTHVTESGELSFSLPAWHLDVFVSIKGRRQCYQPALDTIVIEPDEQRVQLTWRATVPCFKQFLYIDYITVKGKY